MTTSGTRPHRLNDIVGAPLTPPATVTVLRCCPTSFWALCPSCTNRLPEDITVALAGSRGELVAHAYAVDAALRWLGGHPGRNQR